MTCFTVRNNGDYGGGLWWSGREREGNQRINRHLSIFKNQYSVKNILISTERDIQKLDTHSAFSTLHSLPPPISKTES